MRIVYVTSSFPFGPGEAFLLPELDELVRQGHDVAVIPTLARGTLVHEDARALLARTRRTPLISAEVASAGLTQAAREPAPTLDVLWKLRRSRSPRILTKNLAVFAKGLWLADWVRKLRADHIHAHWGGTSATLAMVASRVSRVPWSLTVHRWDIREDNLLRSKARSASFVRAISRDGLQDLERRLDANAAPRLVLRVGVPLPARTRAPVDRDGRGEALRVLVPANLLEVKGHRYLVEALRLLRSRGTGVVAELAGDGPLRPEIAGQIARANLDDAVRLLGQLSHSELLDRLAGGDCDVVALASAETASGEKEGIPVSFLEAMSYGIPVVGTNVGGIPELLHDGAGLLVPPRDPAALADAIESLARDVTLREQLGKLGRERVEREFAVESVVRELVRRFERASHG
jgi:colanic acid/amylovoran biosynthesis glycosyltransferase